MNEWLSDPLVQISPKQCQSQTGSARELKVWENVHPTLCLMCHVSHVCHVSCVTCHLSNDKKNHNINYFFFLIGQIGGAGWWRVCYKRSLGKLSREKICFYLDIVKIALTPAPPGFLFSWTPTRKLCRTISN